MTLARAVRTLDFSYRCSADMPGFSLQRFGYGAMVTLEIPPSHESFVLQLTLRGTTKNQIGGQVLETRPGDFIIRSPGRDSVKIWSADAEQLMLRIDRSIIERAVGTEVGDHVHYPVLFDPQAVSVADAPALFSFIRMICDDVDSGSPIFSRPSCAHPMMDTLASMLLHTFKSDRCAQINGTTSSAAPYYVKRALEFIADRAAEDISLQDIAFASGVSSRALHKRFRRFRDQTPMEYLRDVRLDYARAQLLKARQSGATVTQIAENCGFRHLGRFAQAYLKRFGQLPSEAMIKITRG